MPENVFVVKVTPQARAKVIREALSGRIIHARMTAGQRRAVAAAKTAASPTPKPAGPAGA